MADSVSNSAARMVAASVPMKLENISIPGYAPSYKSEEFDPTKYRVRYAKVDMDDEAAVILLEQLETQGLEGKDIVILGKDKWTFLEKYFMIVTYLELITVKS